MRFGVRFGARSSCQTIRSIGSFSKFLAQLPSEQFRVAADITKRADNSAAHQRRWVQELVIAVDAFVRFGSRAPWPMFRVF